MSKKRKRFVLEDFDSNPKEKKRIKISVKIQRATTLMKDIEKSSGFIGLVDELVEISKDPDVKDTLSNVDWLIKAEPISDEIKKFMKGIGHESNKIECKCVNCSDVVTESNKFNSPCCCNVNVCNKCALRCAVKRGGYKCFKCKKSCIEL